MQKSKKYAYKVLKKYGIEINADTAKQIIKNEGFKVLTYGDSRGVDTILECIDLKEYAMSTNAFSYCDDKTNKFVFLRAGLNDFETLLLLSHELGHIMLGHFSKFNFLEHDFDLEKEANDFAHHLLYPKRLAMFLYKNEKPLMIASFIFLLFLTFSLGSIIKHTSALNQNNYQPASNYSAESLAKEISRVYITKNGDKYHRPDCYTIEGKNAIEVEKGAAIEQGYTPCKICRP